MLAQTVLPVVQPHQRSRQPQRGAYQPLRHTYLQVQRHPLKVVLVGLQLTAQIAGHCRYRPLAFGVKVVQSQIDTHRQRVVLAYVAGDHLRRDAAADAVAQRVGKGAAHTDVLRREVARLLAVRVRLAHRAVAHEPSAHAPRSARAGCLDKGGAGSRRSFHVGHHVQVHGAVAHVTHQGRVVEHEGGIVVVDGDVLAAKGRHVGADGQAQEVVRSLALLRRCQQHGEAQNDYAHNLSHLLFPKFDGKGTKKTDASQAFLRFISVLFQMLKSSLTIHYSLFISGAQRRAAPSGPALCSERRGSALRAAHAVSPYHRNICYLRNCEK